MEPCVDYNVFICCMKHATLTTFFGSEKCEPLHIKLVNFLERYGQSLEYLDTNAFQKKISTIKLNVIFFQFLMLAMP